VQLCHVHIVMQISCVGGMIEVIVRIVLCSYVMYTL